MCVVLCYVADLVVVCAFAKLTYLFYLTTLLVIPTNLIRRFLYELAERLEFSIALVANA